MSLKAQVPLPQCDPILEDPIDEEQAELLARSLGVLADPTRLRLVSLLATQPASEACVCNLTGPLGLTQPTVSYHMKVLMESGIVERERRGRWVYFRVVPEAVEAACAPLLPSRALSDPPSDRRPATVPE